MVKYGKAGHSASARPHGRKRSRKGSSGMKGYSRYASTGKGLSDKGYASWVTARSKSGKSTVIDNPLSYLAGMAALGTPVGWAGKPGYKGSVEESLVKSRGMVGEQTTTHSPGTTPKGLGRAAMGGMGRGEWERPQMKKEAAKGSAGIGTVVALGGLASLAWMVLR